MSLSDVAEVPLVLRIALSALVFVLGGARVYQLLTPGVDLLVVPLPERERTRAELGRAPFAVLWGTAVTTVLLGLACLAPSWALGWLETASRGMRAVVIRAFGESYLSPAAVGGEATGPLPVRPPSWGLALGVMALLMPAAFYGAWRLGRDGVRKRAAIPAALALPLLLAGGALGAASIEDLSGRSYRRALAQWVRHVQPASPDEVWGGRGPVVLYARPTQYREVEHEHGILYKRRNRVEEGELVPYEEIYPFRAGRVTVKATAGEDLVVAGVPSAYEGVIITQEPLRIAGSLDGGVLSAGSGLKLYIAPSEHTRWREDLEALWGGTSLVQDVLPSLYVAWLAAGALWGLGVVAGFLVPTRPRCVDKGEDEP